jgi:hypothetical protein
MKKFIPCLAVMAVASVQLLNCPNLRAQTLTPQLTDEDPPPDPILLYQGTLAIPPTSLCGRRALAAVQSETLHGRRTLRPTNPLTSRNEQKTHEKNNV